jgi:hypothetical protein
MRAPPSIQFELSLGFVINAPVGHIQTRKLRECWNERISVRLIGGDKAQVQFRMTQMQLIPFVMIQLS